LKHRIDKLEVNHKLELQKQRDNLILHHEKVYNELKRDKGHVEGQKAISKLRVVEEKLSVIVAELEQKEIETAGYNKEYDELKESSDSIIAVNRANMETLIRQYREAERKNHDLQEEVENLKNSVSESQLAVTSGVSAHAQTLSTLQSQCVERFLERLSFTDQIANLKAQEQTGEKSAKLMKKLKAKKKKIEDLEDQIDQKNEKIESQDGRIKKLKNKNKSLDSHISRLKEELEDQRPLVQMGVDIRTRFLEQERIHYERLGRNDLDQNVIDCGNSSAHCGNGAADSALFKCNLVSPKYENVFRKMYDYHSSYDIEDYRSERTEKSMMEADLRVSILAGQGIHGGLSTKARRDEATKILDKLVKIENKLSPKDFEKSKKVERLLAEAKEMKDEIVASYRSRFGRRQ